MSSARQWERYATWWQEGFTEGADVEYREQILPLAAELLAGRRSVLDVGTGEGQVARLLLAQGAESVVGVDLAFNQISEAASRGPQGAWIQADSQALPVRSGSFDGALACLVFDHVPDLDRAVDELAHAVGSGGRLVVMINHPLLQTPDSGWIDDQVLDPPEQYWRVGAYLDERSEIDEVDKGIFITFHHRTLSTYLNCLLGRGFLLREVMEPAPPAEFLRVSPDYHGAVDIPRLLVLIFDRS